MIVASDVVARAQRKLAAEFGKCSMVVRGRAYAPGMAGMAAIRNLRRSEIAQDVTSFLLVIRTSYVAFLTSL